jgi:transcription initiation factor TFIIIB Brf1 subunit/transcription initiation factor TFIIB
MICPNCGITGYRLHGPKKPTRYCPKCGLVFDPPENVSEEPDRKLADEAKTAKARRLGKTITVLPASLCQSCYRDECNCPCKAVPGGPE